MDPVTLAFYAVICGVLSVAAPSMGGMMPRLAVGAVVGLAAASILPLIKSILLASG